jgi:membrane protease YdiL (CAAX protease family)
LVLEVFIISAWWASMILKGGSIWPAFLSHFAVNTIVILQGTTQNMIQNDLLVYLKLLVFSLPLGITAIWLLLKMPDKRNQNMIN